MGCSDYIIFINNFILGYDMMNNIKFCIVMTLSKVFAAFVTSFVILSVPMIIGMVIVGREYHGFSHLQIIGPFIGCLILMPIFAYLSKSCFKYALDLANTKTSN